VPEKNTSVIDPVLEESWKQQLKNEFSSPYFQQLKMFLKEEKKSRVIFPPGQKIFSAFNAAPFDKVKVVIIGQDPYHGAGQANGLCFSVAQGVAMPPSLVNIFKEMKDDLGYEIPETGDLSNWARQGVLLLNATLTVRKGEPGSHQKQGWEKFTDAVIKKISEEKSGVVFLLWGKFAQDKANLVDSKKHFVLKAAHPSPFSAYNGFFGCKHFSKANELLRKSGKEAINWKIG